MRVKPTFWRWVAPAAAICGVALAVADVSLAGRARASSTMGTGDLLVIGGTVIDGTGRGPQAASILVRDGLIAQIGSEAELRRAAKDARVVDAKGMFVLPGFIDSHVHYGDWGARLYLNYGVTTVFDIGNQTEWAVAQREGIRRGRIEGPRLFTTGNHLNGPPNAPGEGRASDSGGWATFVKDGPSARAAAEALVDQGVDAFKIQERLSEESLRAIVEVAEARKMPVVGHTVDARDAALLGVRFVEHMRPIIRAAAAQSRSTNGVRAVGENPGDHEMDEQRFGDLIQLLVAKRVHVNPTVFLGYVEVSRHRDTYRNEDRALFKNLEGVPQYLKDRWLEYYDREANEQTTIGHRKVSRFLAQFAQAGGRLLSGTDSGRRLIPGLSLHREMEMLVEAGVTPMEAIRATTQYPAEFFGKQDQLGTVAVGKVADLLIVSADPLRDIANTRKIAHVIQAGRPLDRGSHVYKNPLPRPVTEEMPPVLDAIEPVHFTQGQTGTALRLIGKEFVPDSLVRIGSHTLKPRLLPDGALQVDVPAAITGVVGTYPVSVYNELPGGGTSNLRHFFVDFRHDE